VIEVRDLYDYSDIRGLTQATMFVAHVARPTLVLGGSQSVDVVNSSTHSATSIRRRRGGGGLVLLRPDDIWVDWWIPAEDARWAKDVRTSSNQTGSWWAQALGEVIEGVVSVHEGSLAGDPALRLVCFAGRGPGEVFVDGEKVVGLTQWRVREGTFLSTVLPRDDTRVIANYLATVPEGLLEVLAHQTSSSLSLNASSLVDRLAELSGPWNRRDIFLTD
jgi:lipoate-protein ligase A